MNSSRIDDSVHDNGETNAPDRDAPSIMRTLAWPHPLLYRPATFTRLYPWYILVAALDIMLTWLILMLGGSELNAVAVLALDKAGLQGLVALKFASVLTVIAICEFIACKSPRTARRLAAAAVAINTVPVLVAIIEIARSPMQILIP